MSEETTKVPTQEEMQARQQEINAFYESQIPFLTIQKEYETLVTELEELELRRVITKVKMAQLLYSQSEKESEPEQESSEKKARSLKRD